MTRTASPSSECPHCKGLGRIFAPKTFERFDSNEYNSALLKARYPGGPIWGEPVACFACPAGEIERQVSAEISKRPGRQSEFEFYHFRRAKG